MSEGVRSLARAVVWAASPDERATAQRRLWAAVGPDFELYHFAIWQAGLERADFLAWQRREPLGDGQTAGLA
jgi:hypothetical protein